MTDCPNCTSERTARETAEAERDALVKLTEQATTTRDVAIDEAIKAERGLTEANEKLETATVRELEQWTRAKVLERELTEYRKVVEAAQALIRTNRGTWAEGAAISALSNSLSALSPRTEDRER